MRLSLSNRDAYALGAIAGIAFLVEAVPLIRFGRFAFGYDSGFYRRYVIEPFVSFPNTPVPGLDHTVFIPRTLLDVIRFIAHAPDATLYGTYIALSVFGAISLWFFARTYLSERVALYAGLLYALSVIQFTSYSFFFFKEAVAFPLVLLTLFSFERKRYWVAALAGILIVLSQQTSAILTLGITALGILFALMRERRVSFPQMFAWTAIAATYLFLHPHVEQKIAAPPVGIFLAQSEYLLWSLPIILLALLGARKFITLAKEKPFLAAALTLTLVFAVFHLPFYTRIYVFLDVFLAFPAALGIEIASTWLCERIQVSQFPVLLLLFALVSMPLIYRENALIPLIDVKTQSALEHLPLLSAETAVITSPPLLPWVEGWSLAAVHAPGNLKEPHTQADWSLYLSHTDRGFEDDFLASFPKPLFIFADSMNADYVPVCHALISPELFEPAPCR